MIVSRRLTAQAATPADAVRLRLFVERARRVHQHLDWQAPADWLGSRPFYFALDGKSIAGVLAAPPDPPGTAWLRLLALADGVPAGDVLRAVWPEARRDLEVDGAQLAAALAIEDWVGPALAGLGFQAVNEVVVLARRRQRRLAGAPGPNVAIRGLSPNDVAAVMALDRAAFAPPWQISERAMQAALDEAVYATVAQVDGARAPAGFQISTLSHGGGHLARLAVAPALHGRGIATGLVADAIDFFDHRRAGRMTVNTQQDNHASLAVYERLGFARTGERFGVWQTSL